MAKRREEPFFLQGSLFAGRPNLGHPMPGWWVKTKQVYCRRILSSAAFAFGWPGPSLDIWPEGVARRMPARMREAVGRR